MGEPTRDPYIPELLSMAQAAERLQLTKQGVHRRYTLGQLPGAPAGNAIVFRAQLIEEIAKAELGDE